MNGKTCAQLMLSAGSVLLLTLGCGDDETAPTGPVDHTGEVVPAFDLTDANPNSATHNQSVSPRDYLLQVSAWYFSHSTWGYCRDQFGLLNTLQAEIRSEGWPVEVSILGVNEVGYESGNDGMSTGRVLPLLQDTASENVWADWDVVYRDVIILDSENVRVGTFNLTDHDLNDPANYAALKALLADLAGQP